MTDKLEVLRLVIRGLGHVVSFKNSKMIARGRLITDPKKQEQMDRIIRSFESQLLSAFQTTEGAILTVPYRQFLTASLPADDDWKHLPEIHLSVALVPKGEEGAEITIERIK